jgi:opacity protein-like surface antigen
MRLLSALAPLLLASTAYAQAPGEMTPMGPPPPVTAAPQGEWSVMQNRLSIGLSVGQVTIANDAAPDQKTDFSIGELTLRYRLRPEWEAELLLGGGNEKLKDGSQGDRQLTSATIGLRYRFRPAEQLNWFLLAGLGGSAVASSTATSDQRDAATRGHVQVGAGIEYRWTHFALQAEFRLTAMGQPKGASNNTVMPVTGGVDTPPSNVATPPATSSTQDTLTGSQLTIGASYYF